MPLIPVTHTPIPGQAGQFSGTLESFMDILGGRSLVDATATLGFDSAGNFTTLRIDGGAFGNVAVSVGDWVVFPSDPAHPAINVPAAQASTDWTAG